MSWIVEGNVPEKYYLSARACQGILNRASRRGKVLPEILQNALQSMMQWWWLTCKMAAYLQEERATLGSLFDGIGGFPLVWETLHGKGTAIWASEIEEFPITVTKYHFGED